MGRRIGALFVDWLIAYGLAGLAIPPLLATLFAVLDLRLPLVVPVAGTVVLGGVMFFLPDYNARDDAKKARAECAR